MNGRKFKELRENKGLLQKELGIDLMLSMSTISMYEQEKREPDNQTLKRIANYFEVSIDYLLDNENVKYKNEIDSIKNDVYNEILNTAGIIKENETYDDKDINRLMNFIKINKDYIKK